MRRLLFFVLLFCVLPLVLAAQELELVAPNSVDALAFGERVQLEIKLRSADGDLEGALGVIPLVDGLVISAGAPRSGADQLVWTLSVDARRPGRFRLPPISVAHGGQTLKTDALELSFVEQPLCADQIDLSVGLGSPRLHVGEVLDLEVRIKYREAFFRDQALQTFGRRLGLPVQVSAAFWEGLDGLDVMAGSEGVDEGAMTMVLNGKLVRGRVESPASGAEGWSEVVLHRRFRALAVGARTLGPITARFDYATAFEDDFLAGRRPVDRLRGRVYSSAVELIITEPPLEGRPATWAGAIGQFSISTTIDRDSVDQGEVFTLDVTLRGEGNLEGLEIPEFVLPGFHQFGQRELERPDGSSRRFRIEVAALSPELRSLPPLEFSYFDSVASPPRYEIARSSALDLVVRPTPGFEAVAVAMTPNEAEAAARAASLGDLMEELGRAREERAPISTMDFWFALSLPLVAAVMAFVLLERRRRDRVDPAGAAARRAYRRFRREFKRGLVPLDHLLAGYLGDRLGRSPSRLIVHDHADELIKAGVKAELAGRSSELMTNLLTARYSGGSSPATRTQVEALIDALERDFRAEGGEA